MALTGFWAVGFCRASQSDAIDALNSVSPIQSAQFLTTVSVSVNDASSVLISSSTLDLSSANSGFVTHSVVVPLTPCDPAISVPSATFDYDYAAALWSLAFTFVVGLYLVSRSAGSILDFIRR